MCFSLDFITFQCNRIRQIDFIKSFGLSHRAFGYCDKDMAIKRETCQLRVNIMSCQVHLESSCFIVV